MTMAANSSLNVSLEPHLVEALSPLVDVLPEPLSSQLDNALQSAQPGNPSSANAGAVHSTPIIAYSLLASISSWSRTPDGLAALRGTKPPLQPSDYSMIALLAGTVTSPERKFPEGFNNKADSHDEMADRRAITAVLNALLSILGAGAATWLAADKLAWRNEWRVLLALLVATVVAVAEAGLFLIWSGRGSKNKPTQSRSEVRTPSAQREPFSNDLLVSPQVEGRRDSPEIAESSESNSIQTSSASAASNLQTHVTADNLRARMQSKSSL